jgi:hypothetical protein
MTPSDQFVKSAWMLGAIREGQRETRQPVPTFDRAGSNFRR